MSSDLFAMCRLLDKFTLTYLSVSVPFITVAADKMVFVGSPWSHARVLLEFFCLIYKEIGEHYSNEDILSSSLPPAPLLFHQQPLIYVYYNMSEHRLQNLAN